MMNRIIEEDMRDIYSRSVDWNMLNGKTVLLTGAYGMLASYVVLFLLYLQMQKLVDVSLIAVVRNKKKFAEKFAGVQGIENVKVVQSDLSEPLQIDEPVDYIIYAKSLASP